MNGLLLLGRRQFGAHRAVPITLAVLVLLMAFVATAWPRLLAGVDDRQVSYELDRATVLQRDVIGVLPGQWPQAPAPEEGSTDLPPDVEAVHGGTLTTLQRLRQAQPEPLRSVLGAPHLTVETNAMNIAPVDGGEIGRPFVALKVDPQLTEHARLVEGAWPVQPDVVHPEQGSDLSVDEIADRRAAADAATGRIEVALSTASAQALEWDVGTERAVPGSGVPLRLAGTFEPLDADAGFWDHNPHSAAPHVVDDLNLGTSATASAYLHPAWPGALPLGYPVQSFSMRTWFPVQPSALTGDAVETVLAQVRGFTAAAHPLGDAGGTTTVAFASELPTVLERLQQQQTVTATVLAVVAAGPAGVTLAVFLLGARLLVSRRRPSLALLAARGGSGAQLRAMLAGEGLVLGLPAAALGIALATWLVPGRSTAADLVLPAAAGVVPAVMLAVAASPRGLSRGRADLGAARSRGRWMGEVVLVALAVLGLVLLRQRGVATATGAVDPFLAGVPLLLTLATCVLVLRAYPWPVRALEGVLRRRRGLTAFLGAARAVREPAGGLVPAVALVVGVSVALLSAVLTSTVSHGVQATAWTSVGADLRLSGPTFDEQTTAEVAALDGVAAVTTITDAGAVHLSHGQHSRRVSLLAVEPAALREVQADGVGIEQLPAGIGRDPGPDDGAGIGPDDGAGIGPDEGAGPGGAGGLPAVVSADLGPGPGAEDVRVTIGTSVPLEVVGTMDAVAGARVPGAFVVVDRAAAEELLGSPLRPRVLLVSVAPGADPAAVLERVRTVAPNALAENPAGESASFLSSPMAAGLSTALVVAVALSVLLVLVAVVMTQMTGAPQRARLLAVLRTMGLDRRQGQGIVAWELAPLVAVAFVAGAVLGVVVPWVLLGAMDLRALTGGEQQPGLVLDPAVLGGVVLGLAAVTALAVVISTMVSRRADLAGQLRIGEET